MYMHNQNLDGVFSTLSNFVGKAATTFTNVGANVVKGAQTFQNLKQAWTGQPVQPAVSAGAPARLSPPTPSVKPVVERPLTQAEIRQVQTALNSRGFGAGVVDGIFGKNTSAAISRFQAYVGIPQTGKLSMSLYNALMAATPAAAQTPQPSAVPATAPQPVSFPNYAGPVVSYVPPGAAAPAPSSAGGASWIMPAALAGGLLLMAGALGGRRRGRR